MRKINRGTFLKQTLKAGAVVLIQPLLFTNASARPALYDSDLLDKLATANDAQVARLLQTSFDQREFNRRLAYDLVLLIASYCCRRSKYYQSAALLVPMQKLAQHLVNAQTPDGTINVGNLESPPDTAFIVEIVSPGVSVLQKEKGTALSGLENQLQSFLQKAGDALVRGGVHTPNHRWVICAALAKINALYPDPRYVARIDEWLAEGIYINKDGNYPERSRIYSYVENTALVTMGSLLNRPALFEPVRRNLDATYYYMEPNGDLVTNDSRRQDQYAWIQPDVNTPTNMLNYYLLYRYMAIRDQNKHYAAIVAMVEQMKGFEERVLNRELIHFLDEPLLQQDLPAPAPLPVQYEKLFAQSHLLRIRRNEVTTTFFGGTDQPLIIASGRSNSPDFFGFRKGNALLKYMRFSAGFFSMGYFHSNGLKKVGNKYELHQKLEAAYYQPLPKNLRKKDGDYLLSESTDGRFWNKMDFTKRPVSNVKTLETTITLREDNGRNMLQFDVKGQEGVQVTIELCFNEGGQLTGVSEAGDDNYFLEKGMGQYAFGGDTIAFGPGAMVHKSIRNLEGEKYSTHFGSLRTKGMHVYITGTTPFTHQLTFS